MTPGEELAQYLGARTSELDASKLVPMLCEREEAGKRVLGRPGWLFELKLDGVRIIADKRGDKVRLFYRKQREATDSYAEVARAIAKGMPDERLILDGEIVAFDEQGRPDFQRLGHRIQTGAAKKNMRSPIFVPVVYVVFDVLAIGPYDLRSFPLEARKEILNRVLPPDAGGLAKGLVRQHPTFENGIELFRLCREHRLEGVVAKKKGSSYKVGERSTDWLKIKCELDAEFVVIGWTEGESDRAKLGALDLGAYEGDRLVFRGRVGSGLHGALIDKLLEMLEPIEVDYPVAEGKYSPKPKRHHCLPNYVVSVRYGGFSLDPSGARFLRFPVFRGIRADVSPKDCTVAPEDGIDLVTTEEAPPVSVVAGVSSGAQAPANMDSEPPIAAASKLKTNTRRIHVTAPTTVVLADGTTKEALCNYFEAVAPALLRHAHGRACALHKPEGPPLWPPPKWTPKFARTTTLKAGPRELRGYVLDSIDTLLFAVEALSPCIYFGPYKEDHPDMADFAAIRVLAKTQDERARGARAVKAITDEIGLEAAAKVGGVGAIDVIVGLGAAPSKTATPLGTLIAHLADEMGDGIQIRSVESVVMPFSPCLGKHDQPVVVAVPLEWSDLESTNTDEIGIEAAEERAMHSFEEDVLDSVLECDPVDVAKVMSEIERVALAGQKKA